MNVDFSGLDAWRQAEVSRHLATTRHLNYGGEERIKSLYFRLPPGHPDTLNESAPAALLAVLAETAAHGGMVKLARLGKGDAARASELLRQCHARASREARDGDVTRILGQLWRDFDAAYKVPADDYERAERALYA